MKELLAFIVLSMPILAVLCVGGLAGYAGWIAGRRATGHTNRWIARGLAALAVIFMFLGDEIAGRIYFHYLCSTTGGVTVITPGKLPAQYWGDGDIPKASIVQTGSHFETRIGENFYIETVSDRNHSRLFRIEKDHLLIRVRPSNDVLSELVIFRYWGGWLANNLSLDLSAESCPGRGIGSAFYRQSFVKIER